LSSQRSRSRIVKSRIIIAVSAPAFAITAIAVGGLSAPALAKPASPVRMVSTANAASALTLRASSFAAHPFRLAASARLLSAAHVSSATSHKKHHRRLAPKQIAWNIMHWFGWKSKWQFKYLNWLWDRESSWNVYATNPYSGAYGIPQAVPGGKMASCGHDWRTSAKTQIRWGMRYIRSTYGSPRRAWDHEISDGWY
jgi:hypothetical protein